MLQISELGALPVLRPTRGDSTQLVKGPERFVDGPQVHIKDSPFTFGANRAAPITFRMTIDQVQMRPDLLKLIKWVMREADKLTRKSSCAGSGGSNMKHANDADWFNSSHGDRCFPGLYNDDHQARCWRGICLPGDMLLATKFLKGEEPVAKFHHPVLNEDWGMFVELKDRTFYFTFKKRQPGWWAQLWDWLADLAFDIIEFVSDLVEIIKSAFCSLAQSYLSDLEKLANRDPEMLKPANLTAMNAKFAQIGISSASLDRVWKGGMTAQAVQALANAIGEKVCGSSATPTILYPAGSIKTRNGSTWRIAVPKGAQVSVSLGQTHQEVSSRSASDSVTAIEVAEGAFNTATEKPWYKRWYGVLGIGVAVTGAATATYFIARD